MHIIYNPVVTSWSEFTLFYPPHAIALDGYVKGPPEFAMTPEGPLRNFNHHEGVDRTCTVATCEQVRRAILLGLFHAFDWQKTTVYINDCDEDVCLSTWLLKNHTRANEPLVRTISQIEDLMDSSSGMFPLLHHSELMTKIRWVFEPCFYAKKEAYNPTHTPMDTVNAVHRRIEAFLTDPTVLHLPVNEVTSNSQPSYTIVQDNGKWALVRPNSAMAKAHMVENGWMAGVEMFDLGNGACRYTLWRLSEYIHWFPIGKMLDKLFTIEPGWGGSDIVGGSPRFVGSKLLPEELTSIIKTCLEP